METVYVTYEQYVAVVTLNREDKRNAVSRQMTMELRQITEEIKANEQVKALVLTSRGERAFCSGGDLKELHGDLSEEEAYTVLSPMKELLYEIATLPVPTLAYLNGEARGGGCELATACDIRIGKEGSRFGFVQGKLGIVPGWGGGALLYERISPVQAFHWLTASEVIDAEEAKQLGWLQGMANELDLGIFTTRSREQLRFWKKQLMENIDTSVLYRKMEEETRQSAALWPSEAHKKAVNAFFSRKNK
ncbi:enoyl-CoA hydratase/isomerase family protein [Salimicrobium humidisoli]|uniref:Ethylmalonyl-CoA decarboxylase n=1 Tax=Salimicrobium humidisoli TaxID=2029857 RepID=A0ABX4HQ30_9BACI|nr:enoyl-CoA hydratase/isomerase family protein [Salimicrobium humidisoli]PBB05301.1 enoyl-CoA hydratase [Salimicrobium humidisoli]